MCSASCSTSSASPITTSSIASSKSSGNRDMCTPLRAASRSTVQSISAAISFSCSPWRIRIAFWTPPTPARDSASGTSDGEACRSCVRSWCESGMAGNATEHDEFARLVMLACHDLRTPLATVLGFTQTLARLEQLADPASRYVDMIAAASQQLGDLVDELALGARIEAGRYQPVQDELNTLELARAAAEHLGPERVEALG